MNKSELTKAIAARANVSASVATAALDAATGIITEALANGDTVTLVGFGSFSVSDRAARTGRNPKTGEEIAIDAHRAPKFTAGKALKEAVNG